MSLSKVAALVCTRCGNDLVYLNLSWRTGRAEVASWASRWFGCDCPGRRRLVSRDTQAIVTTGRGPNVRVERWGPAR